ncbi:MAG: type IIL restriction-modification enzyme MmeI, partial [Planctomyces sp.]
DNADGKRLKESWWRWCRTRPALREAREHYDKVLMHAFPSSHFAFSFIPTSVVIASPHPVFVTDAFRMFAIMQSRVHEFWVRFFASSLKDDLRYTPSDCFDNFPFPDKAVSMPDNLDDLGKRYDQYRSDLMATQAEGLTKTYNRFHDPQEQSSEILHLRELHAAMDRAVLEAYGWHDLAATARCEFLLDYEEEGDGDSGLGVGDEDQTPDPTPQTRRRRRLPWRLRWPDEFRDEVLARLLELNEQRHKEEVLAGRAGVGCRVSGGGEDEQEGGDEDGEQSAESGEKKARKSGKPRKAKKKPATGQQEMEF